jgi:hypothetical protein
MSCGSQSGENKKTSESIVDKFRAVNLPPWKTEDLNDMIAPARPSPQMQYVVPRAGAQNFQSASKR